MILFCIIALFSFTFSQDIIKLSPEKAYELALSGNTEIKRLTHQIEALEIDYELAKKYYLPVVYVGASIVYDIDKRQKDISTNLSVVSTLYEFQRTKERINVARLRKDMVSLLLEQLKRDIQLRILELFVKAHTYEKLTEVKREEMAVAYVRFDRARERKELGLSTDYEVLQWESAYRARRAELLNAQYLLNQTLLELKRLCGIPYDTILELERVSVKDWTAKFEDFEKLMEDALRNNTPLKIKKLELEIYERDINIAKSTFSPKINLRISTDKSGIDISTPIFDAGKPYKVEYLTRLRQSAMAEKERLERDLKLIFHSAPYEWEYLKGRLQEMEVKDRFAEENLTLRRSEYELELAFDLGFAMVEKTEAERQLLMARYDLILFWARLFNLAGREPYDVLRE